MKFNKLGLTAFGKFNNKAIELKEGINLIYGDNESGKTTIHRFIEGMLYGFFKPYTKRKIYTDDYDKYKPWNQNDYFGVIKYEFEGIEYRVQRNFIKGDDQVNIYDESTGEDITKRFIYDNTTRLHQPTSLHMDLNSIVYNNTISIKQLGNKTEGELAKEVKDSLINLGRSLDEDISIKNVMDKLNQKIDNIGTKGRVKTSPYGKIVDEIDQLNREKEKVVNLVDDIKKTQMISNEVRNNIEDLEREKRRLEEKLNILEGYNAKRKFDEAIKIETEINEIDELIEEYKEYSSLDQEQFTFAVKLDNTISMLTENIEDIDIRKETQLNKQNELDERLNRLKVFENLQVEQTDDLEDLTSNFTMLRERERELKELEKNKRKLSNEIDSIDNKDLLELNKEFYEYERLEEERNKLMYDKDYSNSGYLQSRLDEKARSYRKLNLLATLSIIISIVPIALGYLIDPMLYLSIIIPIGMLIYSMFSRKELKSYMEKLNDQISELKNSEKNKAEKLNSIEQKMKNTLNKYECSSKGELWTFINEHSMECALYNDKNNSLKKVEKRINEILDEVENYRNFINFFLDALGYNAEINLENIKRIQVQYKSYLDILKEKEKLEEDIKQTERELNSLQSKLNRTNSELADIFELNGIKSFEEFKEGLEYKKKYEELMQEKKGKESLLNGIIGDNSIEILKQKALKYEDIDLNTAIDQDGTKIKLMIKDIDTTLRKETEELTRLEERIKNMNSSSRTLVEIEEEINRKNRIKRDFEFKLQALEIAKNKINNISKEIQRDFAPKLNKIVGDIISRVSNEKYSEVKITEDIDIKVIDPNTKRLVTIDSLSGGTIDQLYFATRLGIINVIRENDNIPLILDDCFTQYDVKRLEEILKLLIKEGTNRQIILFTCHEREKNLLDKLKVKYNYICL
ncbi:ATP-binding protein [Sporosalibacterium faouarense]|uniref:ATP-binding protein n=1 Tax=Sporosalibacterium faouarense TaxID=516123 RepID=UPI00192A909C|nr:AAA family ATPase [Sporosalibacterium faouarense]